MQENLTEIINVLLSMQRALLGVVTPSLRAVVIDVDTVDKILFFNFFYDGEINDDLFDLASIACTEASANFPEYQVRDVIEQVDYPKAINVKGDYAFLRKE
ncbi:MAG: hypothetical protein NTX49_02145 [Chlamydiae bacterium]|nr:hypothetical protein [Chlamydiota bacterium]